MLTYLHAFTAPRHRHEDGDRATCPDDRRPHYQRLGHAFGWFLEAVDPRRLPMHGGDATAVLVTTDLATLRAELGGVALVGDQPIAAGQVRRLACTAGILPVVLDGDSQPLDLGRTQRLFTPAQRKAKAATPPSARPSGATSPRLVRSPPRRRPLASVRPDRPRRPCLPLSLPPPPRS